MFSTEPKKCQCTLYKQIFQMTFWKETYNLKKMVKKGFQWNCISGQKTLIFVFAANGTRKALDVLFWLWRKPFFHSTLLSTFSTGIACGGESEAKPKGASR
jgi:hypothetical protein